MSVFALADGGEMIFPARLLKLARVEATLRPHAIGTSEGVTSGAVQTTSLPGGRWEFVVYWNGITGADGFEMQSFFRQVGRRVFRLPIGEANPAAGEVGAVIGGGPETPGIRVADNPSPMARNAPVMSNRAWVSAANDFPVTDGAMPLTIDLDGYDEAALTGDVEVGIDLISSGLPLAGSPFKFPAASIGADSANAYEVAKIGTRGVFIFWDNGVLKIDYRTGTGGELSGVVEITSFRFSVGSARKVVAEQWATLDGHVYQIEADVSFGSGGAAVAVSPFYGGAEPTAGKDIAVELGEAALARVVIADSDLPSFERGREGLIEDLTISLREV